MPLFPRKKDKFKWDEKFVWNSFLIEDFINGPNVHYKWILPVIHGFISMLSKYLLINYVPLITL